MSDPGPRTQQSIASEATIEAPTNGIAPTIDAQLSEEHRAYVHALEEVEVARKALFRRHRELDPSVEEWARRTDWLTAVWPEGLGYRAGAAQGIGMRLTRLRDSRGHLFGELTVQRDGMHLAIEVVNLSSGTARATLARRLSAHPYGGEGQTRNAIDWREVLEQLCVRVLDLERAGDAFERVGRRPRQAAPARVIAPYLPVGPAQMWAPPGVGKSTIAAAVAVSLETYAEVIPGWHPVDERRCLVLDWESSAEEWNDRIIRIAAGVDIEPPDVLYRRPRRPLVDQVEALAAFVDREQVGYLVLDSVEKAAGARGEGSTYEEKAERLFLAIDRIGVPALLIDHVTGDDVRHGQSRVTLKSIGSVLKGAWARATYDLKRDPTSTDATVQMLMTNVKLSDARRLPPYEFAIRYDDDEHGGAIRFIENRLDSPELLAALPLADQVWRFLIAEGRAMATRAVAEGVGSTPASIRDLISKDSRRQRPRFVRLPDNTIGVRQNGEV